MQHGLKKYPIQSSWCGRVHASQPSRSGVYLGRPVPRGLLRTNGRALVKESEEAARTAYGGRNIGTSNTLDRGIEVVKSLALDDLRANL